MREKFVIALVVAAAIMYYTWRQPHAERVIVSAEGVTELTLRIDPIGGENLGGPIIGLGYLRWANFPPRCLRK